MYRRLSILILALLIFTPASHAESPIGLSAGQTVYVPIYSNVFSGSRGLPFNLAAMLSIRNVDLHHPISVVSVDYYDNDGKLIKTYLDKPKSLAPLASDHIFIKESDETGGFGANFIVRWESVREMNPPIIDGIMIGTKSGQGVSFVSQGRVIADKTQ